MPRIVVLNPRKLRFSPERATSIDLCVHDLVRFSRHKSETVVIGDPVENPFADVDFRPRPVWPGFDRFEIRIRRIAGMIRRLSPDVITVEEHLKTASYLSRYFTAPVLLHFHNPIHRPKNFFDRVVRGRHFRRIAGVIVVSESQKGDLEQVWPNLAAPVHVLANALDQAEWRPAAERRKTILVVGRPIPEKGILEAAQAAVDVLATNPEWEAVFILNEVHRDPAYFQSVQQALASVPERTRLLVQRPLAEVRGWMESAAICVVPSKVAEAFGRTALEAHFGGAAVVSSGSGGLRWVSGDTAVYPGSVERNAIAGAIRQLIENPALRSDLARRGRQRAIDMFDLRQVSVQWDAIHEGCLSARNAWNGLSVKA